MKTLRLFIVGIVAFALVSTLGTGLASEKQVTSAGKIPAMAYHDQWIRLWEDHVTWTRLVIIGVLDGTPPGALDEYSTRLFENYEDMEGALSQFYDDELSAQFGDLLEEHLNIAVTILNDLKNGVDPTADLAAWYDNANEIATLMNKLNPSNWKLDVAQEMWVHHLDATADEAVAHFKQEWKADRGAYDEVVGLAFQMANFFSNGIIRQFPMMFNGADIALRPNI